MKVDNGVSTRRNPLYRPLIPVIRPRLNAGDGLSTGPKNQKGSINPLRLFTYLDIVVTLFYTGVVYAVNYTITATISSSFAEIYPFLTETAIGLCYLATGGGMIIGSTFTGKMLDWDYRRLRSRWHTQPGGHTQERDGTFSIERARLRTVPLHLVLFIGCVIAWGWCLENQVSIAVPLVLQVARASPSPLSVWN